MQVKQIKSGSFQQISAPPFYLQKLTLYKAQLWNYRAQQNMFWIVFHSGEDYL